MFHQKYVRALFVLCLVFVPASDASAQIIIDGIADKANYNDSVSYRVQTQAGFSYMAYLNGRAITVGTLNPITRPDYYELFVQRTEIATDAVVTRNVRFLVNASGRNGSEWGLPPHVPMPLIQSSSVEFAGARVRLMIPQTFPAGYEIPVVAWTLNDADHPVRANGQLSAANQPSIQVRRGVGSGFLGSTNAAGTLSYAPTIGGIATNKSLTIEASTTWTTVAGILQDVTWPTDSRIHVTGNLTVPANSTLTIGAGTIIRLNSGMDITNNGTIEINGTVEQPVVFMPTVKAQPWGGFISKNASQGTYVGNGVIFTGSGAVANWFGANGNPGSHRSEQGLFYLDGGQSVTLTDAAAMTLAGQLGHSRSASTVTALTLTRFLMQRCTTGGEYTGARFTVNDSAFIECPDDSANFVDGDNDGLYLVDGTHAFTNTLFGWTKDDGIDSGGSGYGKLDYQSCWFEATFHEGNSLSGYKNTSARDTVYLNCGQGIEDGYNAPTGRVDHCLFLLNQSGVRHGDNYPSIGNYDGRMTATNCILLQNHRDLFGYNWRTTGFTNAWGQFFANNNFLTRADTNFPNNFVWNPSTDAGHLTAFGAAGRVGVALAIRSGVTALTNYLDGLPVGLSMFCSNPVSVDYTIEIGGGGGTSGTLVFAPGEMRQFIPAPVGFSGAMRVSLSNSQNADITGASEGYFQLFAPFQTVSLVALGSVWRFRDVASAADAAWKTLGYDDSAWPAGPAELGFGEADQVTLVSSNRQVTTYFRHIFNVANPAQFGGLSMRLRRDDAGVVYLNGNEAYRSPNLPQTGAISYTTFASPNGENTIDTATLPTSLLQPGLNIVAVEIHQGDVASSDLSFDFELLGQPPSAAVRVEIGRFGNAAALFWRDNTYRLQQSSSLAPTNWSTLPGSSPLPVAPADAQRFYRLTK